MKNYTNKDMQEDVGLAAEPVVVYGMDIAHSVPVSKSSTREQVMASTVSVDDYFDELISQVRKDYANL